MISLKLPGPKWMVFLPLLAVLVMAMACGGEPTPTPVVIVKEVIKEVPVTVVAVPSPGQATFLTAKVERLKFATQAPWIETMVPWLAGGSWPVNLVIRNHGEPLIQMHNETGELIPGLASSWEVTAPDATEWTFKLRKGVPFHFGWGEFTAKDVRNVIVLSQSEGALTSDAPIWRRVGGGVGNPNPLTEEQIDSMLEIPDDYTINLHFKVPFTDMDRLGASEANQLVIISKDQWLAEQAVAERRPAGTGPYKVIRSTPGFGVLWERVENHYRKTPEFKEFQILYAPEPATRLAMLLGGEVGMADIPRELHADAVSRGMKVQSTRTPGTHTFILMGGLYREDLPEFDPASPLANVKVREALNHAIPRDLLNKEVFKGVGQPLYVQLYHENLPGFNPRWAAEFDEKYGYNPDRAKALLAEAGYGTGLKLQIKVAAFPGFSEIPTIAEAMVTWLKDIGVEATVEDMEFARVTGEGSERKRQGWIWLQRTGYTTPAHMLRYYNVTPQVGGANYGSSFEAKFIDERFSKIEIASSRAEQERLLREVGDYKYDNYSEIPLFWIPNQMVVDPGVVAEYVWPGQLDANYSHYEFIKAAKHQ